MIDVFDTKLPLIHHDICIVGTGPIGLALAHGCLMRGLKVLMLESGCSDASDLKNELNRAVDLNPSTHVPLEEGAARILGGNSHLWGGRCVPFDPIDFEPRPWIKHSGWPIAYEEVARWYGEASEFLQCRRDFRALPVWPENAVVQFHALESWTSTSHIAQLHGDWMKTHPALQILLNATVVDLIMNETADRVAMVRTTDGASTHDVPVKRLVLACGAVQAVRLLLIAQRSHPTVLGGTDGPLGRFYMGHVAGKIADLVLEDPRTAGDYDYSRDQSGFNRRRILLSDQVQRDQRLQQISFIAGSPLIHDPKHRMGALSMVWLILASPLGKRFLNAPLRNVYLGPPNVSVSGHLANVVRTPLATVAGMLQIYRKMFRDRPRRPTIFLRNSEGRFALFYHAEQSPDAENRIQLASETDALGAPRASIAFHYARKDADRIVRAHDALSDALKVLGVGSLRYAYPPEARVQAVLDQARDGMHQIGCARMASDPKAGVVDTDAKAFGVKNLYLASTAIMPTASHANPTYVGVALARRLAAHLAGQEHMHADGAPRALNMARIESPVAAEAADALGPLLAPRKVLVTGASGKIGRQVLALLRARGHSVVALTSNRARIAGCDSAGGIEWRWHDWTNNIEFSPHLQGCHGVIHLGAEAWRVDRMPRINVEATAALVAAASVCKVRSFVFASSVAVYGSPLSAVVREDAPVMTVDRDVRWEYRGLDSFRTYGRSKVLGEKALIGGAGAMHAAIVRPTVVVDVDDIVDAACSSVVVKMLSAYRYTNFIYVKDVAAAMVWLLEKGFDVEGGGKVDIYNLSDEATNDQRYGALLARLEALSGATRLRSMISAPSFVYNLADMIRNRRLTRRLPLGLLRFPADRLHQTGYTHPFGIARVEKLAARALVRQ
jgi:nucleoside-diphosphate-sugar epimerase